MRGNTRWYNECMDAFEILVIILSVALAIFLLLSIVVIVYLLKVVKSIQLMTEKASNAVENVSNVAASVGKFVTPAAAGKFIIDAVQKMLKNHNKEKGEGDGKK